MVNIVDIKSNLDRRALEILTHSMYKPTKDKINRLANDYLVNEDIAIYGYFVENEIQGIIVLDVSNREEVVISNIAVNENYRNIGIGRKLIDYSLETLSPRIISAETDDDAIIFYSKYGFEIRSLDTIYKDTNRYECKYIL